MTGASDSVFSSPARRRPEQERVETFFESSGNLKVLPRFRRLCNALKATLLEASVRGLRDGPPRVLDLGCGRGGDVGKWARYRVRSYAGLDISRDSIREARQRQASLRRKGQTSAPASFEVLDAGAAPWPLADASANVVSAQFSLQYFFSSAETWQHVESQLTRVLKPGGLFVAVLPDGNVVHQALISGRGSGRVGHYIFSRRGGEETALEEGEESSFPRRRSSPPSPPAAVQPFGLAYDFSLAESPGCCEFAVPPAFLEERLRRLGFVEAFEGFGLTCPAQDFLRRSPQADGILAAMVSEGSSHGDWLTLHALRVLATRYQPREAG